MTPDQVQRAKALLDARDKLLSWLATIAENPDRGAFVIDDFAMKRRLAGESMKEFDGDLEIPTDLMREMLCHGIERCTIELGILGVTLGEPAKGSA